MGYSTSASNAKRTKLDDDNLKNMSRDTGPFSVLELGRKLLLAFPPAKTFLAATAAMYVLNQAHMLPKPLSAVVSKALFWPTLPITMVKRIRSWTTDIDDVVMMGGAPFHTLLGMPQYLYDRGVRGVVNMCEEYQGPVRKYEALGITELRLPTVDHFAPSVEALEEAVQFCQDFAKRGERVYIHCRAGHGRSAAAVLAWMVSRSSIPDSDNEFFHLKSLNKELCEKRMVRSTLWKKTSVREFYQRASKRVKHTKAQIKSEKKKKVKSTNYEDKELKEEMLPVTVLEEEYDEELDISDLYSEEEGNYSYTEREDSDDQLIKENEYFSRSSEEELSDWNEEE